MQAWLLAATLSDLGDVAWFIGLAWTATQVSGPAGVGLVMGAGSLPRAAMMLLGGALADRLDPRRTMVLANLARIVVLLVAIAVVEASGSRSGSLLVVAVVFGIVDALYLPASSTMPRQLVRPDDLGSVAAMFQLGSRLATLIGAPVGGVAVAVGGLPAVMAIDAASFAAIAVVLATAAAPALPARAVGRSEHPRRPGRRLRLPAPHSPGALPGHRALGAQPLRRPDHRRRARPAHPGGRMG